MNVEVPTAPWLPPPRRNQITYRIHQGVLMAFRDGHVIPASLKHRWKVQYVHKDPAPQLTEEQAAGLNKLQGLLADASTGA